MQSISLCFGQGLGNSYSCTGDFVYIRVATYFTSIVSQQESRELSRFYDYGWVAKVKDRVYGQRNGLL
jgi:lantibiotic modifying enzyme